MNSGEDVTREPGSDPRWVLPLVLLAVLYLVWPIASGQQAFTYRDTGTLVYPQRQFVAQSLEEGRLPIWNDRFGLGYPAYVEPTAGVWYPLNLLMLAGPLPYTFGLRIWIHYFLAAAFLFLLCRELGATALGCGTAAAAFSLGGFMVACSSTPGNLSGLAWLPLVCLCFLRAIRTGRPLWLFLAALTVAVLGLESDPVWVMAACLIPPLLAASIPRPANGRRLLAAFIGLGVLAAVLGSIQFLPFARFMLQNPRDAALTSHLDFRLKPARLTSLALPLLRDSTSDPFFLDNFPGGFMPYIASFYVGLPLLLLAAAGLRVARRKEAWLLGGALLLSVAASFGEHTPLLGLLSPLPPFRWIRYSEKAMGLAAFLLPLLAARGFDGWARGQEGARSLVDQGSRWLLACLAALSAFLGLAGLAAMASGNAGANTMPAFELEVRPLLWGALMLTGVRASVHLQRHASKVAAPFLFGMLLLDLTATNQALLFPGPPELYTRCEVARGLPPAQSPPRVYCWFPPQLRLGPISGQISVAQATENRWRAGKNLAPAACGMAPFYMESSIPTRSVITLWRTLQLEPRLMGPILRAIGCQYLFSPVAYPATAEFSPLPGVNSPPFPYQVRNHLPMAFLAGPVTPSDDPLNDWIQHLRIGDGNARKVYLPAASGLAGQLSTVEGSVEIAARAPDSMTLKVRTDAPSLLVILIGHDEGWKARVDGIERDLVKANGTFLSLTVGPRDGQVELFYSPADLRLGAALSLSALLLGLPFCTWLLRLGGRGRPPITTGSRSRRTASDTSPEESARRMPGESAPENRESGSG